MKRKAKFRVGQRVKNIRYGFTCKILSKQLCDSAFEYYLRGPFGYPTLPENELRPLTAREKGRGVKGKKAERYELPPSVSREVVSFDRGGGFEQGEYQLSKVAPGNRLGTHKYKKTGNGHGGGDSERKVIHHTGGIRTALGSKTAAE